MPSSAVGAASLDNDGTPTRTAGAPVIDRLAGEVCERAGIARGDVVEATVVGNPVMHHLFLGIDPTELGGAPFALATGLAVTCPAKELKGLHIVFHPLGAMMDECGVGTRLPGRLSTSMRRIFPSRESRD